MANNKKKTDATLLHTVNAKYFDFFFSLRKIFTFNECGVINIDDRPLFQSRNRWRSAENVRCCVCAQANVCMGSFFPLHNYHINHRRLKRNFFIENDWRNVLLAQPIDHHPYICAVLLLCYCNCSTYTLASVREWAREKNRRTTHQVANRFRLPRAYKLIRADSKNKNRK